MRKLVLLTLLLWTAAAFADAITNGSFENNNVPAGQFLYSYQGVSATGWSFTGGTGVQSNGSLWYFTDAPDGSYTAFLQCGSGSCGSISQDVSGLTAGDLYTLSFYLEHRPGTDANGDPFGLNPVSVTIGPSSFLISPTSTTWTKYSETFTANASTETLVFSGTNMTAFDADTGLDSVSVNLGPVTTPEPGTLFLLGMGCSALASLRRKPKR